MEVSRNNSIPLYHQLKEHFQLVIEDGTWPVGTNIPPEVELAGRFGVSRATVRQAILELVNEGYLYRIQGKGTVVTEPVEPKVEPIGALTSFSENMRAAGITPTRRTLKAQWQNPPSELARGFFPTAKKAFYVERLLIANDLPLGIQKAWYPQPIVIRAEEMFTKESLDHNSLYEILQNHCGAVLDTAEETIDVLIPNKRDAQLLALEPNSPIMLINRNTFDPRKNLVESVQLFYRSDRYRYRVLLSRNRKGGDP